jgi:hypothetical protein
MIGSIVIAWKDRGNSCILGVTLPNSSIHFSNGSNTFIDVDHDGSWDIRASGSSRWYRINNSWYPRKGENARGSLVEIDGHDYIVKYSSTGCVLHKAGDYEEKGNF